MYIGEPSIVRAISFAPERFLQNPKSPNLIIPLWKKILSGFKSLCMILYLFNTWNAYKICLKISNADC